MKKFILIALAFAGLTASAGSIGIKPIVNQPSCHNGSNGNASLVVTGGLAPYTYHWSNGATTATLMNIPSGSYSVTVIDAANNSAVMSFTMAQPSKINASTSSTNVSQTGGNNGCVHVSVNGGTPGYAYHWSNNVNTPDQCGLSAGTYTVTITDAFGCTSTASKTIFQPVVVNNGNHQLGFETSGSNNNGFEPSEGSNGSNRSDITNNSTDAKTLNVTVYPNPANDVLNVRLDAANAELTLINALGQTIIHKVVETSETQLDLSNVAKGTYILITKSDKESVNKIISVTK